MTGGGKLLSSRLIFLLRDELQEYTFWAGHLLTEKGALSAVPCLADPTPEPSWGSARLFTPTRKPAPLRASRPSRHTVR